MEQIKFITGLVTIIAVAIITGTLVFIQLGYNPVGLSAVAYMHQQQSMVKALTILMIPLGPAAILLTALSAYLQRENKTMIAILIVAMCFLIANLIISFVGNVPINNIVMSWNISSIPQNWEQLRDKWWFLNTLRTIGASIAFLLIVAAYISKAIHSNFS